MAIVFLLSIMATAGVVMFARDGYQVVDILFAVFTWTFGVGIFFFIGWWTTTHG